MCTHSIILLKMTHVDLQIVEFIQGELEVGSTVSIVEWEITKERKESEG